jgi:hypothetical protein
MMKRMRVILRKSHVSGIFRAPGHVGCLSLAVLLCVAAFMLGGCRRTAQPGETVAEGHRRHVRRARINRQEMMQDLDRMFLLEEPSKLTDKTLP